MGDLGNYAIGSTTIGTTGGSQQSYSTSHKSSEWRSRKVGEIIPASHNENLIGPVVIAAVVVFLVSIIFWAVGASTGLAGLEIIGKIFFSLIISAVGLLVIFLAGQHFLSQSQGGFSASAGRGGINISLR